ncbi:MAG: RDD family protein [Janthinobacterium lividum]
MSAARPPVPARDTGLPPGVQVGPLARRVVAYVIDSVVPGVAALLVVRGARDGGDGANVPLVVLGVVLALAWAVLCWQQLAARAASPGMRLLKLQLVGFFDGRPVGWGRVLLRWLVFAALSATGVGLLLLIASVLLSPRHQGWHDRAAGAVVIAERPLAPRSGRARTSSASVPATQGRSVVPGQEVVAPPAPVVAPAAPVPAAVAGDPAIGPDLAPLAAEPPTSAAPEAPAPERAANGSERRTIVDGWVAELDDGREIVVRGLVLLGRNPAPNEGEADAELVKLPDESRTVSKTHLALGVDDAGLFVVDRGSTNGSTVTPPGQPTVPVGAFHAVSVTEGSVVSIGDHWVRIRRSAR